MTGALVTGIPLTVGDLLLESAAPSHPAPAVPVSDRRRTILALLAAEPVLNRLGPRARDGVLDELDRLLREALADRLVDLLFHQVSGYQRLDQARAATLGNPRSVERVTLIQFGWRIEYAPSIAVRLDDVPLLTLRARVELIFRAGGLAAVVRGGRLIELHAGSLAVEGRLWLQSTAVAGRTISLPMTLILGTAEGLPLAPFQPSSAAALPAPPMVEPVVTSIEIPHQSTVGMDDDLPVVHFTD